MSTAVSRRWFIGGAASFGTFGCMRIPFGLAASAPRLRFGVVSDIHVIAENFDSVHHGNTRTFRHALKWFDAQGVDAVMVAGDMADAGLCSQLQVVADAWNAVFPGGRSRIDGRPVEKLFIYGNHDWEGFAYSYKAFGADTSTLANDHIRKIGMKKAWEEVFEEEYSPVYRKTVKGYDFVGAHWDGDAGAGWKGMHHMKPWFEAHGKELDPSRPFFYFQHPHPKDTCYGPWAWGHDNGVSTQVLSAYGNAVAFSGHSHYSLADDRAIWQGAFTSIGTGSLRYECGCAEMLGKGESYENTHKGDDKTMKAMPRGFRRNGLLVSVYDDCMRIARRDFSLDAFLGDDWVLPLAPSEPRPYSFTEQAKRAKTAEFPAGAKVAVSIGKARRRKNMEKPAPKQGEADQFAEDAFVVSFPAAVQTSSARLLHYEVSLEDADGRRILRKFVLSPEFDAPASPAHDGMTLPIMMSAVPRNSRARARVVPIGWFGGAGAPIVSEIFNT